MNLQYTQFIIQFPFFLKNAPIKIKVQQNNYTMKFLKVLVILAALIPFTSCEKVDEFTMFDMDFSSSIVVPSSSGLNLPFDLFTPDMETNSEAQFGVENTNKELIEEITLTEMKLTLTAPSDQRFDFLESLTIYINADGLSELEIASVTDIPETIGTELVLTPTGNDLKEYIKKDKFTIRAKTVTDKFIDEEVHITIDSKFHVDAKILGL